MSIPTFNRSVDGNCGLSPSAILSFATAAIPGYRLGHALVGSTNHIGLPELLFVLPCAVVLVFAASVALVELRSLRLRSGMSEAGRLN